MTPASPVGFHDSVGRELLPALRRYARRERYRRLLRVVALLLLGGTVSALAVALLDRFFPLGASVRMSLLIALSALGVLTLLVFLARCLRLPDDLRLAAWIERVAACPPELLPTLIDHHRNPRPTISAAMLARLTADAQAALGPFLARPTPPLAGPWFAAAIVGVVAGVLVAADVASLSQELPRVFTPWRDVEPLTGPSIRVEPGSTTIGQSRSLTVAASLERAPGPLFIETATDGVNFSRTEMSARGATGYAAELRSVQRSLQYRVVALGADGSVARAAGPYTVTVRSAPAVLRAELRHADSAPLNLPIESAATGPDTTASLRELPGVPLTLALTTTEPISRVEVTTDTGPAAFSPSALAPAANPISLTLTTLPSSPPPTRVTVRLFSPLGGSSRFSLLLPSPAPSPSLTPPSTPTPLSVYQQLLAPPTTP